MSIKVLDISSNILRQPSESKTWSPVAFTPFWSAGASPTSFCR